MLAPILLSAELLGKRRNRFVRGGSQT